jgi:hypothetical protein
MVEKAEKIKKVVSQKTLAGRKIKLASKGEKTQCEFCKSKVLDITRHLKNCHLNPDNTPKIEIDWEYWEEYDVVKDHLIKNPVTNKMREHNKIIAPEGNPQEKFIEEMLSYAKTVPKTHKDKAIYNKLDEIFTSGIEVRLLNKEEYIQRLKEKVLMGQRIFLFNPIKPTTIEEIEQNQDELWNV